MSINRKHFYHQIIEIDSLFIEMDDLEFNEEEKKHLGHLIDANLHHSLLSVILSELNEEDKKLFLHHLAREDHSKIWDLLNNRVDRIEEKIKDAAEDVKKELHEDIREAKKLKGIEK